MAAAAESNSLAGSGKGMSGGAVAAVVIILLLAIVAVYFVARNSGKLPWLNSTGTEPESLNDPPTVVAFTNPAYLAADEVEREKEGAVTVDLTEEVDGKPPVSVLETRAATPPSTVPPAASNSEGNGTEEAFAGFEDVAKSPESQEEEDAKGPFAQTTVMLPVAAAAEETFNGFDQGGSGSFAETNTAESKPLGGSATAKSLSMPVHSTTTTTTTVATNNAAHLDATPSLALGDRVTVDGYKGEGTVRFVGPHKTKGSMRVGVELDAQVGKNNGTLGGHVYFTAKERHGVLCFPNDCTIIDALASSDSVAETNIAESRPLGGWAAAKSLSMPVHSTTTTTTAASNAAYLDAAPSVALGDRVTVDGYKGEGTVRFVGPHKTKGSMRVGVELDAQVGKNNGTLGGHVYFTAKERHGVLCFPNDCTIISTANVDTTTAISVNNGGGKVIAGDMPWMEL